MTALPMTLEDALRHQGYTIDSESADELEITLDNGSIVVPAMIRSKLTWQRDEPEKIGDDFYLSNIPLFSNEYRPVLLSHILDRYRTRRLAYNTPGEFRLGFRRWVNLNMTVPNQRYVSTATTLPLDDHDTTVASESTSHGLDIGSDFPQSLIAGNTDYASAANDRRVADNAEVKSTGRNQSIMELLERQRNAYLNVDAEILDGMDTLFFGIWDRGEGEPDAQYGLTHRPNRLDWW